MDQETVDQYSGVLASIIAKRLLRPAPANLWHYTNGDGLIRILESGELWSTQVSCLNDATEFKYAIRLAREAFRRRRLSGGKLSSDDLFLLDQIEIELAEDGTETAGYFVACLSQRADDLSQWRAYGTGEGGYAISFQVGALSGSPNSSGSHLFPLTYNPAIQNAVVDEVVTETFALFRDGLTKQPGLSREDWAKAFLPVWGDRAGYLAPLLKDPAFEAEWEWRLVKRFDQTDIPKMKYRQRQSMLSRHLPLVFAPTEGRTNPSLPITEIMVGPSRHKESSRIAIGDMLATRGYPSGQVRVTKSAAPYQSL